MSLRKIGKVFTSKCVGTEPSPGEKRIYRAAVPQRLRNTALAYRRDGNYDKLESVQPQEETLMSTLQFGIKFSYWLYTE